MESSIRKKLLREASNSLKLLEFFFQNSNWKIKKKKLTPRKSIRIWNNQINFWTKNRQSRSLCIAHKRKKKRNIRKKKKIILVITNSRCHCVDLIFWGGKSGFSSFLVFWNSSFPFLKSSFPVLKSGFPVLKSGFPVLKSGFYKGSVSFVVTVMESEGFSLCLSLLKDLCIPSLR